MVYVTFPRATTGISFAGQSAYQLWMVRPESSATSSKAHRPDMAPFVHIIDDNDAVRDSLTCLLESEDFAVKAYGSAQAFLDGLLPDDGCVLTDVQMPGISGLELLRRLRDPQLTSAGVSVLPTSR